MSKITLDQRAAAIHAVHVAGLPVASVVRKFCEATGHPAPRHPRRLLAAFSRMFKNHVAKGSYHALWLAKKYEIPMKLI
jgi:hypothetical protein